MDHVSRRRFFAVAGGAGLAGVVAGNGLDFGRDLDSAQRSERADGAASTGTPLAIRRVIWSVDTARPLVALTFDDGPHPELTPRILRVLERRGIRATFNIMGLCAVHHKEMTRAIVASGHELGNHTWTHRNLSKESAPETMRQLKRAGDVIEDIAGLRTHFFRPPRGEVTGIALRYAAQLDYDVLLWSVARGVPGIGRPDAVAAHLTKSLRPGAIVGLHDGIGRSTFSPSTRNGKLLRRRREVEIEALPRVLDRAIADGLGFVTVSDLLASSAHP